MLVSHLLTRVAAPTFATIGAFDGVQGDALWPFITAHRWRGVAVEPQRDIYELLCTNLEAWPQVVTINAAVGPSSGTATLYKAAADASSGRAVDWRHQQASLNAAQVGRLRSTLPDLPNGLWTEEVELITFDEVMARAGLETVDIIQIDTEGSDWEVLQSIDLTKYAVKLVIFEHRHLSWSDREAAVAHLIRHRFKVGVVTAHDTAGSRVNCCDDRLRAGPRRRRDPPPAVDSGERVEGFRPLRWPSSVGAMARSTVGVVRGACAAIGAESEQSGLHLDVAGE